VQTFLTEQVEKVEKIQAILNHAFGTQNYHRISQVKGAPIATDGVVAVANEAGCFWLLDAIISYQGNKKLDPDMQVWRLKVREDNNNREATLYCEDGKKKILISQNIEYTDFPLDEIVLWVMPGGPGGESVILLPTEL